MWVNGTQAAQIDDASLPTGAVGIYVGGDGESAVLTRLVVEAVP
jgi:hypothetical protein